MVNWPLARGYFGRWNVLLLVVVAILEVAIVEKLLE